MPNACHKDIYKAGFLSLWPQGVLWDAQRDDIDSDVHKLSDAFAAEASRQCVQQQSLVKEASVDTAVVTIERWEKSVGIVPNPSLPLNVRRNEVILKLVNNFRDNKETLDLIASEFGYVLTLKPRPQAALYGQSFFGERMYQLNQLNTIVLNVSGATTHPDISFENEIRKILNVALTALFTYT